MLDKARAISTRMIGWRREFHAYPELGFQERHTASRVAEELEKIGYQVRSGVGQTGVVGDLGSGKPVIAIRADMDALPIQEANQVEYASRVPGLMHACGHDAHVAIALGVATLLAKEEFPGMVRFLFQPSEEIGDEEGISGAPRMIAAGAMEAVDMVIALHVDPSSSVGDIRIDSGPASGGVDSWFGAVIGKGGHGAKPHETVDPFILTAHVIFGLNNIVSRRLNPFHPAVVSIGTVKGGDTENVIPERVEITGTLRFTETIVREQIHAEIERVFELTRALGGDYELRIEIGSPPMVNHPQAAGLIRLVAAELLGDGHVLGMKDELGAEDFGSFMELCPGAMFSLGAKIEADPRSIHNPRFDIDESALQVGAAILAATAVRFLRAGG